ncbi:sigma-70 family RNA polymerase sigma factor [Thermodesulfobacteriota bacterium]
MTRDKNHKTDTAEEDTQLVREFQSGDKSAFDVLVLKYKDKVFNLCYRFLGEYQEADDISQDVFVKAYRSLNRFRLESSFFTWLYRITVNTCKNRLKSLEYRYKKRILGIHHSDYQDEPSQAIVLKDNAPSPVADLLNKEKMLAIQRAINSLPVEQKTVVMLRDVEGFSYEEITDMTGYKLGTLKSRLARARIDLRKKLREIL